MTGGCCYPGECEKFRETCGWCPALTSPGEKDLSRNIWKRKRKSWSSRLFHLVVPSRYLAKKAQSSGLLCDKPITVIANGRDVEEYRPINEAEAKSRIKIDSDRAIILFGAVGGVNNPRKGYSFFSGSGGSIAQIGMKHGY